jgi:hypothetical protein
MYAYFNTLHGGLVEPERTDVLSRCHQRPPDLL